MNNKAVNFLIVLFFFPRMPVESASVRNRVGRFPTVGFGDDTTEEKEVVGENDVSEENACRQWMRKVCPCCCPKLDDDDITDTVVTGIDDTDKEEGTEDEKPATDENELDGDWRTHTCVIYQMNISHVVDFSLVCLCFHRTPPDGAINRPDEKQIGAEPHGASHKPLPKR